MTVDIEDDDSNSGFTLKPARSRGVGAETQANVYLADDVALVTVNMEDSKGKNYSWTGLRLQHLVLDWQ